MTDVILPSREVNHLRALIIICQSDVAYVDVPALIAHFLAFVNHLRDKPHFAPFGDHFDLGSSADLSSDACQLKGGCTGDATDSIWIEILGFSA